VVSHQQDKTLLRGSEKAEPMQINGVKYGVLACSGAIAPQYYQELTKDGAEVLVNSASIASMGLDGFYFDQSKQMSRFIAIANNKQFVQSSRGGQSYVISKDGKFEPQSKGTKTQYFNIDIQPNSSKTLYSNFGEWFLAFTTVSLGVYLIYSAIKKT
jgi:apolipoprotein N-acyltransferase